MPSDLQEECDIDFLNNDMQTALHIAVHQGHGRIVERLVGFGAKLNTQVLQYVFMSQSTVPHACLILYVTEFIT